MNEKCECGQIKEMQMVGNKQVKICMKCEDPKNEAQDEDVGPING